MLVRAGRDRRLSDGTRMFERLGTWAEAGLMNVDLPAVPGRKARRAIFSLRFGLVELSRPKNSRNDKTLPETIPLRLVIVREPDPPPGQPPAIWFLLTTHQVNDCADARRIAGFYRKRWVIEQLFRTMKTKGFDIEALWQQPDAHSGGPLEKLVTAIPIAAVTDMQLVAERDGASGLPLSDICDPDDQPVLEAVCRKLEGKTHKQKNLHPPGSLARAAWIFARLGGWTGYYGKPGPVVMIRGLTQFHAIKHGWELRNV